MNIIELAQEAGFMLVSGDAFDENAWFECFPDQIKHFAELVAAAERKKCAALVEEVGRQTAAAIRARGDKHD